MLLLYIVFLHFTVTLEYSTISVTRTIKWMWNDAYSGVERYSTFNVILIFSSFHWSALSKEDIQTWSSQECWRTDICFRGKPNTCHANIRWTICYTCQGHCPFLGCWWNWHGFNEKTTTGISSCWFNPFNTTQNPNNQVTRPH